MGATLVSIRNSEVPALAVYDTDISRTTSGRTCGFTDS